VAHAKRLAVDWYKPGGFSANTPGTETLHNTPSTAISNHAVDTPVYLSMTEGRKRSLAKTLARRKDMWTQLLSLTHSSGLHLDDPTFCCSQGFHTTKFQLRFENAFTERRNVARTLERCIFKPSKISPEIESQQSEKDNSTRFPNFSTTTNQSLRFRRTGT